MMKKIFLGILVMMSVAQVFAQENETRGEQKTLFSGEGGFGGYLGLNTKITTINNQDAIFMGGELAFNFGHAINIGIEGYGMVTGVLSSNKDFLDRPYYLEVGYGGLHIEPVIFSEKLVHVTVPILIGGGGVVESDWRYNDPYYYYGPTIDPTYGYYNYNSDAFLVFEPGLMVELNVFKFMRMSAGASYRFTNVVTSQTVENVELSGLSGTLSMRFGWF